MKTGKNRTTLQDRDQGEKKASVMNLLELNDKLGGQSVETVLLQLQALLKREPGGFNP